MRTELPDVTVVAISSMALDATVAALKASTSRVAFGQALLLSDREPESLAGSGIEWRKIAPLRTRADYSRFMLHDLADQIETAHALCVQWDGFVLNGGAWDPRFLHYDYIGAVWPHFDDRYTVGNGGFSLRSKRLLEACRDLPPDESSAEDVLISRICRPILEQKGIRFAPEEVARNFSYERCKPTGLEFGFHGAFNLVRYLRPAEATRLFRSLEPALLTRSEHFEILRGAARRGHIGLAMAVVWRLLRWKRRNDDRDSR